MSCEKHDIYQHDCQACRDALTQVHPVIACQDCGTPLGFGTVGYCQTCVLHGGRLPDRDEEYAVVVAVALSLYRYNVSALDRAQKLYDHFQGNCAELEDLVFVLTKCLGYEATEFAYPTAEVYVRHALEKYGDEARERVRLNRRWSG